MDRLPSDKPEIDWALVDQLLALRNAHEPQTIEELPGPSPLAETVMFVRLVEYQSALCRQRIASIALQHASEERRSIAAALVETLERHDYLYDVIGSDNWSTEKRRKGVRLSVWAYQVPSVGRRTTVRIKTVRSGDVHNDKDDIDEVDDVILPPKPRRRRRVLPLGIVPSDRRLLRRLAGRRG